MRQIALDQNLNHAVDKIEVARYILDVPWTLPQQQITNIPILDTFSQVSL